MKSQTNFVKLMLIMSAFTLLELTSLNATASSSSTEEVQACAEITAALSNESKFDAFFRKLGDVDSKGYVTKTTQTGFLVVGFEDFKPLCEMTKKDYQKYKENRTRQDVIIGDITERSRGEYTAVVKKISASQIYTLSLSQKMENMSGEVQTYTDTYQIENNRDTEGYVNPAPYIKCLGTNKESDQITLVKTPCGIQWSSSDRQVFELVDPTKLKD